MIDEEELKKLVERDWDWQTIEGIVALPKLAVLRLIEKCPKVPMKSPEQIENVIKHATKTAIMVKYYGYEIADLLRAVLNQPQKTWDEKIFEKEEKDGVQKNTPSDRV